LQNAIIVDVRATTAIRQAEASAAKRMIERSLERFELYPERLIGDTAYGSAEMLDRHVHERGIEPAIQGSTNLSAPTVLSRATTSTTTTPLTPTAAPWGKPSNIIGVGSQCHGPA
jgi:hypothetical protein